MPRGGAAASSTPIARRVQQQVPLLQVLFCGFWSSMFLFAALGGMIYFRDDLLVGLLFVLFAGTMGVALLIPAGFLTTEQFEAIAKALRLLRDKEK